MGIPCSTERKPIAVGPALEKDAMPKGVRRRGLGKLVRKSASVKMQPKSPEEYNRRLSRLDREQADKIIAAQDGVILSRREKLLDRTILDGPKTRSNTLRTSMSTDEYYAAREELAQREKALAFDWRCSADATREEKVAAHVLEALRARDDVVFETEPPRVGYGGQEHARFAGDHFLSNVELIEQTHIFAAAKRMPKGAHLHIHFNACLKPNTLLEIAKTMGRMFIWSTLPLTPDMDYLNYHLCEIQFSILPPEKEAPGNLFSAEYQEKGTMRFKDFLEQFPQQYPHSSADEWLLSKLVFHEEEAHNILQTASGAWAKFNGRTRMMKGLFNYETAYRRYTRALLEDFVKDRIQYAEIRPNFMATNQLWKDDASAMIDNAGIMDIIIDECNRFRSETRTKNYFAGLKIIYCTPRSFEPKPVADSLAECLRFKLNPKYRDWIAGFDLVGEEGKGKPLNAFISEFLKFKADCREKDVDIPFLFHCGETLEMGTSTDGNILDALLLGSRRIGHGFSLARHPYVMEQMKSRGICLELCPISNEVLGLTPRVNGHAMYNLLANNVHCTVNSDNGTLFRSTLSHDFYQALIGKADMTLYGWKQLILWSLQHACITEEEYRQLLANWQVLWREFVAWLISYGKEQGIGEPTPVDEDANETQLPPLEPKPGTEPIRDYLQVGVGSDDDMVL